MSNNRNQKAKFLGWYFNTSLVWRVLIALILGAIVGTVAGPKIIVIEPFGTLMLKLLQLVILPLIFFAIVVGVGGTPASKMGRISWKIMSYYLLTTLCAAAFGLILGYIFKPGLGANIMGTANVEIVASEAPSVGNILVNMVPNNAVAAFAGGNYLQVLIFGLLVGLAISVLSDSTNERVKETVKVFMDFCEGGSEIMYKITKGVLEYTPVGIFALISVLFATQGFEVIGSLGKLIAACYIGYILQILVVYGGLLTLFKMSYKKFIMNIRNVMLMAFATRSSNSVLPVTISTCEERLGISRTVAGFTLPLGAQVNMDGEAYYQIISVMFVANAIGIELTFTNQILMILAVTLGSIGTAGIAGSGPVVLMAVLGMVGLPAEPGSAAAAAFALILGIDVILDMGRTTTNVTGDAVGTTIVAKTEDMMDYSKWDNYKKVKAENV
ncbi:dicarboxylate/amino acid:cation symporter [Sedimentibacter sp.]|uniref:dicarboxylate/amino acid:cation symporter n=1 Tax=Sedimentibacter sp. TaxID=1960295 RepID=UPI0028A5F5A5|nr:dicarboxylate/amino acid:cation symporter [Sedimentibacter sp.]